MQLDISNTHYVQLPPCSCGVPYPIKDAKTDQVPSFLPSIGRRYLNTLQLRGHMPFQRIPAFLPSHCIWPLVASTGGIQGGSRAFERSPGERGLALYRYSTQLSPMLYNSIVLYYTILGASHSLHNALRCLALSDGAV